MFKAFLEWWRGKKKDNALRPKQIIHQSSKIPLDDTKPIEKNTLNDLTRKDAVGTKSDLEQTRCELAQLKKEYSKLENIFTGLMCLPVLKNQGGIERQIKEIKSAQTYDETLLDKAREQWKFGEWEKLSKITSINLEHHPDRAKLALLVAAAFQRKGEFVVTRQWVRLAKKWGCEKKLIARILIAGVYNTLGRAADVSGNKQLADKHFEASVSISSLGISGPRFLGKTKRKELDLE